MAPLQSLSPKSASSKPYANHAYYNYKVELRAEPPYAELSYAELRVEPSYRAL